MPVVDVVMRPMYSPGTSAALWWWCGGLKLCLGGFVAECAVVCCWPPPHLSEFGPVMCFGVRKARLAESYNNIVNGGSSCKNGG